MHGFHERLRELRQRKHLTLDALAQELDTTKTTLSRYENNRRLPDADFIVKAAHYFNVSTDYLLKLSNHPTTVSDFLIKSSPPQRRLSKDELNALLITLNNK